MTQEDDEQTARVKAFREALKRREEENKQLKKEERRQKGFLQKVYDDSNGIARKLGNGAGNMMASAIGFEGGELSETVGPVLTFFGGLTSAFALSVASVPFAVAARTTKITAAIIGRRLK